MKAKKPSLVEESQPLSRRAFLGKIAIASMGGTGFIALAGSLELSIPRVILETTRFKAGKVTDFPLHVYTFLRDKNVFVYRDRTKIQALSAVCTHLGCIVTKLENGFECPCHGSRYDSDGTVLSGPAPRPLNWLKVELAPDGQLIIDTGKKVGPEDGLLI